MAAGASSSETSPWILVLVACIALLGVLLLPGVSSHSKWVLLVVLASGAIVAVSLARSEVTA